VGYTCLHPLSTAHRPLPLEPALMAQGEICQQVHCTIFAGFCKYAIVCLEDEGDSLALKANKVIEQLDFISEDSNLPSYTRTQISQLVSLLASVE